MSLFTLPISSSVTTKHSNPSSLYTCSQPPRKRKRSSNTDSSSDSEFLPSGDDDSEDRGQAGHNAASTNPLSLTPAEIAQYNLAGLNLHEKLPHQRISQFPHRGLEVHRSFATSPDSQKKKSKKKAKEEETFTRKNRKTGPKLRLQHFQALVAVLQRCLLEGDIKRAERAWGLLIRAQIGGQGLDLRESGYWGVGAELLMRSFDKKPKHKFSYESDTEDEQIDGGEGNGEERWAWGSKQGLERVKEYFERLILQHPYKRHFDTYISALDFWPQMVACEIYGIQKDQQIALERLEQEEAADDGSERSGSESEASDVEEDVDEDEFTREQRRKERRLKKRAERRWTKREDIRQNAQAASERIAARLDEVMVTPPYADSHNLLCFRGMLALYIGDLYVPALPERENEDEQDEAAFGLEKMTINEVRKSADRRLLCRQRAADHERGLSKRKEEFARARKLFEKIANDGGEAVDVDFEMGVGDKPEKEAEDNPFENGEPQEHELRLEKEDWI